MTRARPAGEVLHPERDVARPARPESERGERRAEQRHDRGAGRGREVQRRRVVRHQRRGLPDQGRRLAQRQAPAGVDRPPAGPPYRGHDGLAQLPVGGAPDHDDRDPGGQSLGQLGVVRPAFAPPDRPRGERHERLPGAAAEAPFAQHPLGGGPVGERGDEGRGRLVRRLDVRQRQQPIDLVPGGRPSLHLCVQRRPAVVEPDAPRDASQARQQRRPQGSVGKIRRLVALGAEGPDDGQKAGEPPLRAALVVAAHAPYRGERFQQGRRGRRGHDVEGAVAFGERGEEGRRQHHVAQEGGLDDEGGSGGSVGHWRTWNLMGPTPSR